MVNANIRIMPLAYGLECVCEKIEIQIQTAQIEQFDRERMNLDDKWRTRIGKNGSTNVQFVR